MVLSGEQVRARGSEKQSQKLLRQASSALSVLGPTRLLRDQVPDPRGSGPSAPRGCSRITGGVTRPCPSATGGSQPTHWHSVCLKPLSERAAATQTPWPVQMKVLTSRLLRGKGCQLPLQMRLPSPLPRPHTTLLSSSSQSSGRCMRTLASRNEGCLSLGEGV